MEDLARTVSNKSQNPNANDGHSEGNLNITAFRHGWSRTLSVPSHIVEHLDYSTLEGVLELNTLKLSSVHTRVFVEHPPNSDTWAKIRFWKDDGSLQSVLIQTFFTQRMQQGIVTKIDVRDRNERNAEDGMSIKSGIGFPGSLSRPGQTREWLKHNKLVRTFSTSSRHPHHERDDTSQSVPPPPPPTTRLQAFKFILGLSTPPVPPKAEEKPAETPEETLRKNGWMPPVIRRITSRKSSRRINENPFFGGSSSSLARVRSRSPDIQEEGDGEEINLAEGEGLPTRKPQEGKKWFGLFNGQSSSSRTPTNEEENPFSDENAQQASTSAAAAPNTVKKRKGKKVVGGASVVRTPADAIPPPKD